MQKTTGYLQHLSSTGSSPFWAGSGGQHLPAPGFFHAMEGRRCPPLPDTPDIPKSWFFMAAENRFFPVILLEESQSALGWEES